MVLTYTWQIREWREAHLLSTGARRKRRDPVPMGVLVVGVMLLGGIGDAYSSLKHSHGAVLHDRLVPVLLSICALACLSAVAGILYRRQKQIRNVPLMPIEEQRTAFHERGWATPAPEGGIGTTDRPWSALVDYRRGRSVLVLLMADGAPHGVPLRVLTLDQEDWLLALLDRKLCTP